MTNRHTILVVDDEPDVVKSVQDLLRLDYRVLGTTRAADGLGIMEQEEVHVVMTDQRMPGMTGVEFLSRVRGKYPDAIRLLFTGYADLSAVVSAINEGNVYRYITKPWDPEELQGVIREACERYDLIVEKRELMDQLQQKNVDMEKANVELRQSSQLKEAFIQVASHELRTPLTILVGLSDLAAQAQTHTPPLSDWLKRIQSAARRLQYLVDELIQMLSARQYARSLERRDTDLASLLNQSADDVRPFIDLRHQTLVVQAEAGVGPVSVDANKIRDCINHLLLNAVKFTPDGGTITLRSRGHDDRNVELSVSDTGVGMDAAMLQRLFEPFFTGFDVTRHASGHYEFGRHGLGLGLCVVREFVRMHGGTVSVRSEPSRGTTITILLPRR